MISVLLFCSHHRSVAAHTPAIFLRFPLTHAELVELLIPGDDEEETEKFRK